MTASDFFVLLGVGALASAINAVAGGGSLISFPTLTLGFGLESKMANATNSVGLWPGSLGGALGFRDALPATRHYLRSLLIPTLFGSGLGAWLLIQTRQRLFDAIVPALILFAALLLAFQPQIRAWSKPLTQNWGMGQGAEARDKPSLLSGEGRTQSGVRGKLGPVLQFLVAVYGGYFGAGMGIMMLAVFSLFMKGTIHEINAVKNWLGVAINLIATVVFASQGVIKYDFAAALMLGGLVGGFAGAKLSQRLDPDKLRVAIAIYGVLMASYFAYKAWF